MEAECEAVDYFSITTGKRCGQRNHSHMGQFETNCPMRSDVVSVGCSRKQDVKTFLRKVMVVCQHVREPFVAHGKHRNAIRHAIFLVQTCFVEAEPFKK